ncbi:Werner Syndrome-like exonuclease [Psilocybe cubensis]|uniref:Werner Syndrome-like exonuclease n=1 Tax=Psilocybe cubensis TaxID=181762 RepID=A0ACB8GUB0_PSICU|nr:Werner Syndrome-like exonuclease [Psilocybe cubensis]KAH9478811.1 Werner Syndrome-like exonuclease [Psilocybe cubensis]
MSANILLQSEGDYQAGSIEPACSHSNVSRIDAVQTPPAETFQDASESAVIRDRDVTDSEADDEFGLEFDLTLEDLFVLDELEREALKKNDINANQSTNSTPTSPLLTTADNQPSTSTDAAHVSVMGERDLEDQNMPQITLAQLREVASHSQRQPFFTPYATYEDSDTDDDAEVSDCEDEAGKPRQEPAKTSPKEKHTAWFKRPQHMPKWLYDFFVSVVQPLIYSKHGRKRGIPAMFSDNTRAYAPPSFWINPPEPCILLSKYRFDLPTLWRPRIYVWIPHDFVKTLCCPNCGTPLEKNGASRPRRIIDIEDNFYIVTWKYYCRDGCKSAFRGWNTAIVNSLPAYLRLAFPAVLSRRSGVSTRLLRQLRVCNQHKMGPSGYRSMLLENHTFKFSQIQNQYLEAVFEMVRGQQHATSIGQETLHAFVPPKADSFGNFTDPDKYAGFVPSERYLASMMNKAIERDESDANQHTACLAPDQIAIDDSHKVNKHIAKVDGVPVFTALFTCMDSKYIQGQALTLTKSHEERSGPLQQIAKSVKRYGHDNPSVMYSDDPVKDKPLLYSAFPELFEDLMPTAAAHGLTALDLPDDIKVSWLASWDVTESTLAALLSSLDSDSERYLCVSLDAEWNLSRKIGVSVIQIAPHSLPNVIYVIPVHKFGNKLPPSLLRLLISNQVFKIGSGIKGDITRLKKQFPILGSQLTFNLIDLKEYCVERGLIARKASGSLEALCEGILKQYLPKEQRLRRCEDWELKSLSSELLHYAARDVFASRILFEKAMECAPIARPQFDSPAGTPVALLSQEGSDPIAYGVISPNQPTTLGNIRVKTPNRNRLVLDIHTVISPSAAVMLHLPSLGHNKKGKTKSGALTLEQIRASSLDPHMSTFKIVAPLLLMEFDFRASPSELMSSASRPNIEASKKHTNLEDNLLSGSSIEEDSFLDDTASLANDLGEETEVSPQDTSDLVALDMLEAYSKIENCEDAQRVQSATQHSIVNTLQKLINSPPDAKSEYTRVKKDIFHAFHMIPISVNHGARPSFLRAMRDHLMRWDPKIRVTVDEACQKHFNLTFEQMLLRNPRFIAERTPRYVPSPSILVPALKLVFETYGNALDVKTGLPLFSADAQQKANAVIELAREGYLSDIEGVVLYERAGIDKYGLQKYKCLRGTNNVEGGPHGDIYRKFGALHEWINGDLYEKTTEEFGVCKFPDSLRIRLGMEPYSAEAEIQYRLNSSDNWLRKRQGLALPVLPPTTLEARKYFFLKIRDFAALANDAGQSRINFEAFAQEWNRTANGKERVYITTEVLAAYSKTWEKMTNIRASQELIQDKLEVLKVTANVFAAEKQPFPIYLSGTSVSTQPRHGVIEIPDSESLQSNQVPSSLSVNLSISRPPLPSPPTQNISNSSIDPRLLSLSATNVEVPVRTLSSTSSDLQYHNEDNVNNDRPTKRRRIVPDSKRKRSLRKCRRCLKTTYRVQSASAQPNVEV